MKKFFTFLPTTAFHVHTVDRTGQSCDIW